MGLLSRLFRLGPGRVDGAHPRVKKPALAKSRICQVEALEPRCMLAADINFGGFYFEEATGDDSSGDTIEITFEGGAANTELTRVVIDGDKLEDGAVTLGDVFFDLEQGGLGAFEAVGIDIATPSGFTIDNITFGDGIGSGDGDYLLAFDLTGFTAGDKLVFTVDVDEQGLFNSTALAEGGEFEGTRLTGFFSAEHYLDAEGTATYFDQYDNNFAQVAQQTGSVLNLPPDDFMPPDIQDRSDRTAGAVLPIPQLAKPITIAGTVFEDMNRDNDQDPGDLGIENVDLELLRLDGGVYVATGLTTSTDGVGDYKFEGPELVPGDYRIVEAQPAGYLSVGAKAGTIDGLTEGNVLTADIITDISVLGGQDSIDNDFAETKPAELHGFVYHDRNNNGVMETGDNGIGGVVVELKPVDVLGMTTSIFTITNGDGEWSFLDLMPGKYRVVEVQPPSYLDGIDQAGDAGGAAVNPGDEINGIMLAGNQIGQNYKFGEYRPGSISGRVHADTNGDCVYDPGEELLEGVVVQLLNADGDVIDETTTDVNGEYTFDNLAPGTYGIREFTPDGYFDGNEKVGTGSSTNGGLVSANDLMTLIEINSGDTLVDYDFCELVPGSISGRVHADTDGDCEYDPGEELLEGIVVQLLNADGDVIDETTTDVNGEYLFNNLAPGTYGIREITPNGYFDGGEEVGTGSSTNAGLVSANDLMTRIEINSGDTLVDYDFCELVPGSISGRVHADTDGDCEYDPGEELLEGVVVQLLNANGDVIDETTTDANGEYLFDNLAPGTYGIREITPDGYFDGNEKVGTGSSTDGGLVSGNDLMTLIEINSGDALVDYDFCELPPASLSGYVFQDGAVIITADGLPPVDIESIRDGQLTPDDTRLEGVTLQLRNGVTGLPIFAGAALPGTYNGPTITTVTDVDGFYQFTGLRPGNYAVYETQPDGYFDSLDTAGTLGGLAINPRALVSVFVLNQLQVNPKDDAIVRIALFAGQDSQLNNFSEIVVDKEPTHWWEDPDPEPPTPAPPLVLPAIELIPPVVEIPIEPIPQEPIGGSGEVMWYTWHLSIVNAGQPRSIMSTVSLQGNHHIHHTGFDCDHVGEARWQIKNVDGQDWAPALGTRNSIPVTGDFNGDGVSEIGVYVEGHWYIDVNGNGVWDDDDLWAKLGTKDDKPVVGDWDGDGKDDIGIFGPAWAGDPRAVAAEPGLPEANNMTTGKYKNLPPQKHEATLGERTLQRTASGRQRSDVIDHVFNYGSPIDEPVTGDFNGDGIQTIAIFRDGIWYLDVDGNGRWTEGDRSFTFGAIGDRPLVGDWDGNGVDEVAVYRGGTWILDSNGNGEIDSTDKVFELGGAGDIPIAGDWNGDGADQPGVFNPLVPERAAQR